MTRGELVTQSAIELGMNSTAGTEDGDRLRLWAQEGVDRVLLKTKVYVVQGDMTLSAGVTRYRLDTGILAILSREARSTNNFSLVMVDYETLQDYLRAGSVSDTSYMALLGHDLLVVAPSPTTSTTIRFDYVPRPTRMTADGNDPSTATYGGIPDWGHEAILAWMRYKAAIRNDKQTGANIETALGMFERECGEIRKWMRAKRGRGLTPARIGYPGRSVGRRNDVYYSGGS